VELYHFPEDLLQIIGADAGEPGDLRELARAVGELSDLFVGKTPWRAEYAASPDRRRAYLSYYLPVNLPKVQLPLAEWLRGDPLRFAGRILRAIDLGAGPGTALLGLVDWLRRLSPSARPSAVELVAIDQSHENLKDADALLRRFAARMPEMPLGFEALRCELVAERSELFTMAAAAGRFDLVIAANVLCEVIRESENGFDRAAALIEDAADRLLADSGAILVVEPGLRETARDLHRLRDHWLGRGRLHVHAPCLHEAPCPALATTRDWCIADLAWQAQPIVAAIDRLTGLRKGSLKFAYLVLAPAASTTARPARWRVVSDVLDLKGERRVYLCADGRWIVLGQLKREAADAFAGLQRGDLVEIDGMERKGAIFRLSAGARVRIVTEPPAR